MTWINPFGDLWCWGKMLAQRSDKGKIWQTSFRTIYLLGVTGILDNILGMQFLGTAKLSSTLGRQSKGRNTRTLPCLGRMNKYSSIDDITSL